MPCPMFTEHGLSCLCACVYVYVCNCAQEYCVCVHVCVYNNLYARAVAKLDTVRAHTCCSFMLKQSSVLSVQCAYRGHPNSLDL